MEQRHTALEETISPVSRSTQPVDVATPASESPQARSWPIALAGLGLIGLLVGVFFVLPKLTESSATRVTRAAVEPAAPEVATPALSEEQYAELDARAQRDLAALVTQQSRLEERSVAQWGDQDWLRYQELSRAGDDAYLQHDVAGAAESYRQALDVGVALLERGSDLMDAALEAGEVALEQGDAATALAQFEFALSISPDVDRGRLGLRRAERLPRVLALIDEAQAAMAAGELPTAIERYRDALALDPNWAPAREGLARASGDLDQYRFERVLSQGFATLADGDFDAAIEHFSTALEMRPGSEEAQGGLFQAQEGERLNELALARVRAIAFERRELWSQAIDQYESALATDATLEYAIEGLARARARRDLELKLLNFIDNPRILLDDTVLVEAQRIRAEAGAVDPRGERLADQLARLDSLLNLATQPLRVVLRSDALTQVTVYRVGTIGMFTETELALRPGEYTAIGSRNGYRDVRRSFTVLPGQRLDPIEVVCVEPI